jgi:hypothetical protein
VDDHRRNRDHCPGRAPSDDRHRRRSGDAVELEDLVRALKASKIIPSVEDALRFARDNLVLLLRHVPTGVDLDVSFAWTAFEIEALRRRHIVRFGAGNAPMATPEDLVVFKVLAARPKDMDDALALLVLQPDIDIARVRKQVTELSAAAGEPELVDGLEALLSKARRAKPRTHAATPRKRRSPSAKAAAKSASKKKSRQ